MAAFFPAIEDRPARPFSRPLARFLDKSIDTRNRSRYNHECISDSHLRETTCFTSAALGTGGHIMSQQIVVHCPSCSQKYRVDPATVGHRARCAKCGQKFLISSKAPLDEDTILAWISDSDPASESVMGSTGLFQSSEASQAVASAHSAGNGAGPSIAAAWSRTTPAAVAPRSVAPDDNDAGVRLASIGDDGAHFEFPVSSLTRGDLRDAFPRKCVGCGVRQGLFVHLVYWPDRMKSHEAAHWQELQNTTVGDWEHFAHLPGRTWLNRLPRPRHCLPPFNEPFPLLLCRHCHAAHEVQGRVIAHGTVEWCSLTIHSLATAVEFYRNNGGRHTPEYQHLIEQRDIRHDKRNELHPDVRNRLSHWFTPLPGEEFVRYFPDTEFSAAEAGNAGAVLTVRRLVFKKFAAYRDYPLHQPCRLEIKPDGPRSIVHIFEEGHRPAVFSLSQADANQLVTSLRTLACRWRISR